MKYLWFYDGVFPMLCDERMERMAWRGTHIRAAIARAAGVTLELAPIVPTPEAL